MYSAEGGYIGVVAEVVYDYSARWDRPSSLVVRGGQGAFGPIGIENVVAIDAANGVVRVRL